MISANEAYQTYTQAAAENKAKNMRRINDWMREINLEENINNVCYAGKSNYAVSIKDCPDRLTFKEVLNELGYRVDLNYGYDIALIDWSRSHDALVSSLSTSTIYYKGGNYS